MPHIFSYSDITVAIIPQRSWEQAWFALASWKGFIQALPGHDDTKISARELANGDVRCWVKTSWHAQEYLQSWTAGDWTAPKLFERLDYPATDVSYELVEDFS